MMQETMEKQRRKFIRFLLLFDETRLKLLGYVSGCIQTRMNKQSNTPNKILHLNLCLERDLRCSELDKGFVHESCTQQQSFLPPSKLTKRKTDPSGKNERTTHQNV